MTDPSRTQLFGQMVTRIARYWRRAVDESLAQNSLSQATAMPLIVLSRLGPELRQGVIAEELGLEGPSLVRVVELLVAEGLVCRREDPQDRRVRLLRLTRKGEERVAEIEEAVAQLRARYLSDLSETEIRVLLAALSKIEAALVAGQRSES